MNFLQELDRLRIKTPRLYNINIGSENSDYCTHSDKNKNCYLVFAANFNEDCMYGGIVLSSRDSVDCFWCNYSELCYECVDIDHCYNSSFSQDLKNCSDCMFCYDCIGCQNCFLSTGLRQKSFYFRNEPVKKEEYQKKVKEFLKTEGIDGGLKRLDELKFKIPHRATHCIQSENSTGDYLAKSKNCYYCFDVAESEDCLYLQDCIRTKDSVDMTFSDGSELCYECFSIGLNAYNCNFCNYIRTCSDCEYCELCFNCKNCFGCIGLQSKEFYILNKAYSKEDYFKKVAEIKQAMRQDGTYGKHLETTYKYEDTAAMV